jgi:protein-tyrosine-phosphatase
MGGMRPSIIEEPRTTEAAAILFLFRFVGRAGPCPLVAILSFVLASGLLRADIPEADRKQIDTVTGAQGSYVAAEDTYRVTFPRTDIKPRIEGRTMHPFMGFTSWAAFTPAAKGNLMVMGDLVLLEDEVNPVLSTALANGFEVTALHNHFFYESPRVMFMHIGGSGSAASLANAVRKTMDKVKEIRTAAPGPATRFPGPTVPDSNSISASALDAILAVKGQSQDGMYKATIGRDALMHGVSARGAMGVNTWAAFAGTDASALVDGDFAMLVSELQGVLKALRQGGINIVAIHNHMTHEEPQYVFLHYWGKGGAAELAKTLRAALDTQKSTQLAGVLFVCEHGAARSIIAAEYFNKIAASRGLMMRATARGVSPDATFSQPTVEGLKEDGFEFLTGTPRKVDSNDVRAAGKIVAFAVDIPGTNSSSVVQWTNVPGPGTDGYAKTRDDIRRRVEALVDELMHSKRK